MNKIRLALWRYLWNQCDYSVSFTHMWVHRWNFIACAVLSKWAANDNYWLDSKDYKEVRGHAQ